MHYLSPMDAAFLRMESKRAPMHVGAMMTFRLPEDAPRDFVRDLMLKMREKPFMPPPLDCRLARGRLSRMAPAWEPTTVDMEYHLRHSALPFPGGERELGVLVARLHSHPLDLLRPLWECHLIEGLENRRFALYFKAHHCAIDGMGAVRTVQHWLSRDPLNQDTPGPWVLASKPPRAASTARAGKLIDRLREPMQTAAAQARGAAELGKALVKMVQGEHSSARRVVGVPRSLFNVPVSQQRRLGTQILELPRVKAIAAQFDATANDVVLAVVGGAVRRYLLEHHALPGKSLLASVPVAIKRRDGEVGNAAAGFVVPMETQLDDPLARLQSIRRITARGKADLGALSRESQSQFAMLGITPLLMGQMLGVLPKLPPLFNVTVSNVVLGKEPLYLKGAELEAMYPASFLFDGYALNVTVVGYSDRIALGFLGCRDTLPSLQRLAVYARDALAELERACAASNPATSATAAKKSAKKPAPSKRKA